MAKKDDIEQGNKPICPRCGRKVVFYRSKTNDFRCRQCGKLFKWDNEEKE